MTREAAAVESTTAAKEFAGDRVVDVVEPLRLENPPTIVRGR